MSRLGRTDLMVSTICVGTAAWGVDSPVHGLSVSPDSALATAERVFDGPLNFLDTSNNYGDGESERRIGRAIRTRGGPPHDFVLQTKVDSDPVTGAFDRDRVRRSLDESLERLGLDRVPVLYLHDPERLDPLHPVTGAFTAAMADDGPVAGLLQLRDEGYADFVGIGAGHVGMLRAFVETDEFDVVLTHNRFTLVDRSADDLLTLADHKGLGVLNAAVYGGGVLSSWPRRRTTYHYAPASAQLLATIDAMGQACARHDVPLLGAALQFSTRDQRIDSTVCGMVSSAQVEETCALADLDIPEELWDELDALCPPPSTWLDAEPR